jgi:hypothetical protein
MSRSGYRAPLFTNTFGEPVEREEPTIRSNTQKRKSREIQRSKLPAGLDSQLSWLASNSPFILADERGDSKI